MTDPITAYAQDVVDGKIPAGKFHVLGCRRHLRDMARQGAAGCPFRFDVGKAERFFRFAEKLKHYKGKWAGTLIHLEPWEKFIAGSVVGWVHVETGLRRFRTALVQVPRKNGKSLLAAIVLLYVTFFDDPPEPGALGVCIATKRDQAKLVFEDAKQLVKSSGLKRRITVQVASLHRDDTASKAEPLGADHDVADGLNPSFVCVDEMHAMKDRGLLDVVETATGAREQPVIFEITTFGSEPVSPWGDQNDYSQKILEGVLVDESFFVFTAHADSVAYDATYQFDRALRELVEGCSCRLMELDVPKLTTPPQPAIQPESPSVGGCASLAMTDVLEIETPAIRLGSGPTSGRGQSEIRSASAQAGIDGLGSTQTRLRRPVGKAILKETLESQSKSTTDCIQHSMDGAAFAPSNLTCLPWTTATIRSRFADCFANPAMPDSDFSEILKSAYSEHSTTCAVRRHRVDGPSLIVRIEPDDWTLPETAQKANPNYAVSVSPEDLAAKVLKAKGIPSAAASYKIKHLNLCVSAANPCLSVDGWRRGQNPAALSREAWLAELDHAVCFAGIDLASKLDLCALSLVFPPAPGRASWRVIQRIWTPAETLVDRAHRDRAPYGIWRDQGWLTATEGTQIDHQLIRAVLIEAREKYDLHLCGFDPWHADTLVTQLKTEDGFGETQVLGIPQTYGGMSSACLKMQAEIASGTIDAFGCPVTAWSVSNVVDNHDGKGNLMFAKGKSRGRIDPVISATIGMSLALKFGWAVQPKPRRRGVAKIWQPGVGFVPAVPEESQPHA
jgi:phage terminase large subunit-like protein